MKECADLFIIQNQNLMRLNTFLPPIILIIFALLAGSSCKRDPYIIEYKNLKGYVIGKETCNTDERDDYWLIDFTYGTNNLKVGDTLVLNGITYTNVLKTKGKFFDERLKIIGLRVSIDYKTITTEKISTSGCDVQNPVIYSLKEITIIYQGEIR